MSEYEAYKEQRRERQEQRERQEREQRERQEREQKERQEREQREQEREQREQEREQREQERLRQERKQRERQERLRQERKQRERQERLRQERERSEQPYAPSWRPQSNPGEPVPVLSNAINIKNTNLRQLRDASYGEQDKVIMQHVRRAIRKVLPAADEYNKWRLHEGPYDYSKNIELVERNFELTEMKAVVEAAAKIKESCTAPPLNRPGKTVNRKTVNRKTVNAKSPTTTTSKKKKGFHKEHTLSPQMAYICGVAKASRPNVVKCMWKYIKKHNLQNPANKREIVCDEHFKKIMGGRDRVTMFSMNKFIGPHLTDSTTAPPADSASDDIIAISLHKNRITKTI